MGLIRTLLAISVLITHSEPIFGIRLLNGDAAVTCFYIISGFLITLILLEKYSDLRAFYVNRALRIYVPYFAALLFSIAIFASIENPGHAPVQTFHKALDGNGALFVFWSAFSNLTLIGTDLTRYITLNPDFSIAFPSFLHGGVGGGQNLLFIPQSWTLSIELQWYLLAPLIVRLRVRWLAALTVALLINRMVFYELLRRRGFQFDDAAIFPLQLQYFLLGALGYHGFRVLRSTTFREQTVRRVAAVATVAAIGLVVFGLHFLEDAERRRYDYFYIAFAALIPFAFYLTRGWKLDGRIGEYSYPIYLFHFGINALFFTTATSERWLFGKWQGEMVLLATLIVSTVYIQLIDHRVQRIRARIARGMQRRKMAQTVPVPAAAE